MFLHNHLLKTLPYFTSYWDSWRRLDGRIASGESARRYYSTKEFILKGVPKVFVPRTPSLDTRFFDPSNTWYIYDNRPLKESLEKFAKFPISTSFEKGKPRLASCCGLTGATPWSLIATKRRMEQGSQNTVDMER